MRRDAKTGMCRGKLWCLLWGYECNNAALPESWQTHNADTFEPGKGMPKYCRQIYGKLYLFTFVGMAINPILVGKYFFIGVMILICSLFIRSVGVMISLVGTNLSKKEKLFCVIAYLPKATVQSAKASIPLQMGVLGGDIMQAIAILSVLITAPIGAIGINLTCEKLLHTEIE